MTIFQRLTPCSSDCSRWSTKSSRPEPGRPAGHPAVAAIGSWTVPDNLCFLIPRGKPPSDVRGKPSGCQTPTIAPLGVHLRPTCIACFPRCSYFRLQPAVSYCSIGTLHRSLSHCLISPCVALSTLEYPSSSLTHLSPSAIQVQPPGHSDDLAALPFQPHGTMSLHNFTPSSSRLSCHNVSESCVCPLGLGLLDGLRPP